MMVGLEVVVVVVVVMVVVVVIVMVVARVKDFEEELQKVETRKEGHGLIGTECKCRFR